jgi:hypothetical protein
MGRTRLKRSVTRTLVTLTRTLIEASAASLVMALNNPDGRVADPKYQN